VQMINGSDQRFFGD